MLPGILTAAVASLCVLPVQVFATHSVIHHKNGTVQIDVDNDLGERDVELIQKRSIYLNGFDGCDPDQKQGITSAWLSMLTMANDIKGKIDFNEAVSTRASTLQMPSSDRRSQVAWDYLGSPTANADYQDNIRGEVSAC